MKRKRAIQLPRRRLYLAMVDGVGTILYTCFSVYNRALAWHGEGLSDKERAYALKRRDTLKTVADDMSRLTQRLRNTL